MATLNINTDAAVVFANQLEALGKNGLPNAVRGTLNKAAFDVKTRSMPNKADSIFEKRSPNFFKANSRFDYATGSNINTMKSQVGFIKDKARGNPFAIDELEQQEIGGTITHRSFIALESARGGSFKKSVRANARLKNIKKLVNGGNTKGSPWAQKAIKAAVFTGKGNLLLMPGRKGSVVWKIDSIKRKDGNIRFTKTKLYSFNKNRAVKVHATNFMKLASEESAKRMEDFWISEAKRQIAKYLSR